MARFLSDSDPSVVPPSSRAPRPAVLPQHTTAAMERFECVADRCEDTCCRDWAVPINRDDLDTMKAVMSSTAEGRERLIRLVVIGNRSGVADGLGQLQMNSDGACPMLEDDNRCGVHTTFGEQALTTPCSVFPRTALALDDRVEVGGSLGCPEVARLMLLPEEALQLRPAITPMLPRAYVGKAISADPADTYAYYFLPVREALLRCFQQSLAIGTQFVLAADFAERAQPFFNAETSEFQGARRRFAEHRLQAEIGDTESAQLHTTLDRDLALLDVSGEAVAGFIRSLLLDRRRLPHSPRFATLLEQVFESLESEILRRPAQPDERSSAGDLWRVYAKRRDALDVRMESRSNSIFSNYCQHFLMRNPYTDAVTLSDYLYSMGMQLAALRFLTIGHPDLAARMAGDPDLILDRAVLDNVAVHVVQTFTKAISHHPEYLEAAILHSAAQGGRVTFGRLVLLAKFV